MVMSQNSRKLNKSVAGPRSWCLGATAMLITLMIACSGETESPVAAPSMLAASPATAIVEAPASESPAAIAGATPAPPAASSAVSAKETNGEPDSSLSDQVTPSRSYWPGWSGTDCATYTRRLPAFCEAMKDAEVAEPEEISTDLTAITPHNQELVWSGTRGESRLLVLNWTSFIDPTSSEGPYDPGNGFRAGESMVSTRDVFVTVVPELHEWCQANGPFMDTTERIEQLVGFNSGRGEGRQFVELWADPQDLFRPSPDPEISDGEAELDFPWSGRFVSVSEEHVQWFREFKSMSYQENGLPWTRLGYTYDWGNPDSDIGLSEFVIRKGAKIEAYSITPTEEYC